MKAFYHCFSGFHFVVWFNVGSTRLLDILPSQTKEKHLSAPGPAFLQVILGPSLVVLSPKATSILNALSMERNTVRFRFRYNTFRVSGAVINVIRLHEPKLKWICLHLHVGHWYGLFLEDSLFMCKLASHKNQWCVWGTRTDMMYASCWSLPSTG